MPARDLTGPGTRLERSASQVRRDQSARRLEDANASTRPNQTTVAEVQARRP